MDAGSTILFAFQRHWSRAIRPTVIQHKLLLILAVAILLAGCAVKPIGRGTTGAQEANEMRFVFVVETNRAPLLSTNEVMELGWERARRYRRDMTNYFCNFLYFAGDTTNSLSNRWILHFQQKQNPCELHSDFFVDVDDATKAVDLLHD